MLKKLTSFFNSFLCLNIAQSISIFNDNFYKLILIFFLINYLGVEHSNTILSLAGTIFVIPFLLFATLAGSLADRYSKRTIIFFTRILEITITLFGLIAIAFKSIYGGYIALFFLAFQSALVTPAKYGVLAELTPKNQLAKYNGMMSAATYLAVILGTFGASLLADITNKNFVICAAVPVIFAIIGTIVSLGIGKTVAQDATKPVSIRFIRDIIRSLIRAYNTRYLLTVILFSSYFLFMGAYLQLNIIPYSIQSLGMTEVEGGYLFLVTALGIGLGSFIAGRLCGSESELAFSPLAGLASVFCYFSLYFYSASLFSVIFTLFVMGVCAGFYAVPLEVFIQIASPDKDRGENIATANFLSFIGVILASGFLAVTGNFLELSAATGFAIMGGLTLFMMCMLLVIFSDQVFRFFFSLIGLLFWDLKVVGKQRLAGKGPVVLVGQKTSWLDAIVILATLPRLTRYIMPVKKVSKRHSFLSFFFWLIPMKKQYVISIDKTTKNIIEEELKAGHSICLMQPTKGPTKRLSEWKELLNEHLKDFSTPVIPLHIDRHSPSQVNQKMWGQFLTLFRYPIRVAFGSPLASESSIKAEEHL